MNTHKKTAVVVGALFLIAMLTSIVGGGLIESVLTAPEGLLGLPASQTQLVSGVLLELVNAVAVIGIAVLVYPVLRKHTAVLALGYVGLRIVEAVIQILGDVIPLSLLAVSRDHLGASAANLAALQASSAFWVAARVQLVGTLLGIFFSLGALLFYVALVQSGLVPRWLSLWGLTGAVLILVWNLSGMFGLDFPAGMVLALPMILNEITLGIWLMIKGFDPAAIASGAAQPLQTEYA